MAILIIIFGKGVLEVFKYAENENAGGKHTKKKS